MAVAVDQDAARCRAERQVECGGVFVEEAGDARDIAGFLLEIAAQQAFGIVFDGGEAARLAEENRLIAERDGMEGFNEFRGMGAGVAAR